MISNRFFRLILTYLILNVFIEVSISQNSTTSSNQNTTTYKPIPQTIKPIVINLNNTNYIKEAAFSQSNIVILIVLFTIGLIIIILSICLPWTLYGILKKSSRCKCLKSCFRIRTLNTNENFNLNMIDSDAINNNPNQNDLPKYDDLAHPQLNLNRESVTNDATTDAIHIGLNEATTTVEPPKYDELKINKL